MASDRKEIMLKPVQEIRKGDQFVPDDDGRVYWTAMVDAKVVGTEIHLDVRYPDGGCGSRIWDTDQHAKLEIKEKS